MKIMPLLIILAIIFGISLTIFALTFLVKMYTQGRLTLLEKMFCGMEDLAVSANRTDENKNKKSVKRGKLKKCAIYTRFPLQDEAMRKNVESIINRQIEQMCDFCAEHALKPVHKLTDYSPSDTRGSSVFDELTKLVRSKKVKTVVFLSPYRIGNELVFKRFMTLCNDKSCEVLFVSDEQTKKDYKEV